MNNTSAYDLSFKRGAQGEMFIEDIRQALTKGNVTIEVKTDDKAMATGRFYIEHECLFRNGWGPSGLNVTKAAMWALVFGNLKAALFVEIEWLRRACARAEKDGRKCEHKRGTHPTRGVAITMRDLIETAPPEWSSSNGTSK